MVRAAGPPMLDKRNEFRNETDQSAGVEVSFFQLKVRCTCHTKPRSGVTSIAGCPGAVVQRTRPVLMSNPTPVRSRPDHQLRRMHHV